MATTHTVGRVDRLVANLGLCTRREANAFIRQHVRLDGAPVPSQSLRVRPERLTVRGQPLTPLMAPLFLAMHKPVGAVCSRRSDPGHALVFDLLPREWTRRRPALVLAGRLDARASGLLLLAQDGQWVHAAAARGHEREYEVRLAQPLGPEVPALFASGTMMLRGEETPLLPAQVAPVSQDGLLVRVVLQEGRYHQLRRMFEAAGQGNTVLGIRRVRVAGIKLGDLAEGETRQLTPEEIASVVNNKH